MAHAACEEGIDYLGVSCLQEGILLREASIKLPILVFGAIHIEQIPELIQHDLEFTIASHYKARIVAEAAQALNKTVKVHLEVDTGMQRTGVRTTTAPSVIQFMREQGCFANPRYLFAFLLMRMISITHFLKSKFAILLNFYKVIIC